MNNKYKLSDNVIGRIAQIVQEAMLLGVDAVDLLRQVEVETSDAGLMELSSEYVKSIKDMHVKLLEDAERLAHQDSAPSGKLIFNG